MHRPPSHRRHRRHGGCAVLPRERSVRSVLSAILAVLVYGLICDEAQSRSIGVELDCDPCIDRPTYAIKVIVHGTASDPFWQRVRSSSVQSGLDMRVDLEFGLYDSFDPNRMASDITEAATGPAPPDALIVTIPSAVVEDAVIEATKHIPVFGMNSGYEVAESLGILGFVSMDERMGGAEAAVEFVRVSENKNVTRALFVNHEKGNSAMEARLTGFRDNLQGVPVDELVVDTSSDSLLSDVEAALAGCRYDAVLLGGGVTLAPVTAAFNHNGCPFSDHRLGSFDTSGDIYADIAAGRLSFAVSQQSHLQGALSVVLAATYASTGKTLARSAESDFGIYFSGPQIVNVKNLPSDTLQACEADAFPVCSNADAGDPDGLSGSACKCIDRSKITIGGVLHGTTTDSFWDAIFTQAHQAADDLQVDLKLDRLEPQPSTDVWHSKMASKMISLCQEGVDGLFITIPSDIVYTAIKECLALNIPVVSVNTGAEAAAGFGLIHHIGQIEYSAGYGAGVRMVESGGMTEAALCLDIEVGNSVTALRCQGFEDALGDHAAENGVVIPYLGKINVPKDNQAIFIKTIEEAVGKDGNWEGIGMLSGGASVMKETVALKELHPELLVGIFDTSNEIYDAIADDFILFGIDQNSFMQGYIPIWLLTLNAYTKQHLQNQNIETGPSFIDESPSSALQICEGNNFEVCPRPIDHEMNQLGAVRPIMYAFAGLAVTLSLFFAAWVTIYRKHKVVQKSQPLFLLLLCVGTLLMASAIFPLGIDDSMASSERCSQACMAAPWLLTLGFITAFSALFSKIWRIHRLMQSATSFRRVKLETRDVIGPFAILVTLSITFLLVWTLVDPMYWERTLTSDSVDGLNSYGFCVFGKTRVSVAMASCLLGLCFSVVVLANYSAYKARNLSTEFSESKYIAIVMIGFLQVMLVGIPLIALTGTNPEAGYFVKSIIIWILTMSILLFIFVPKLSFMKNDSAQEEETALPRTNGALRPRGLERGASALRIVRNESTVLALSRIRRESDDSLQNGSTVLDASSRIRSLARRASDESLQSLTAGITRKQMRDLQQVIAEEKTETPIGPSNIESFIKKAGIPIEENIRRPSPLIVVPEDGQPLPGISW